MNIHLVPKHGLCYHSGQTQEDRNHRCQENFRCELFCAGMFIQGPPFDYHCCRETLSMNGNLNWNLLRNTRNIFYKYKDKERQ